MSGSDAVLLFLAVALTVNVVIVCVCLISALRAIVRVGEMIDRRLGQFTTETTATLAETREALGRLEMLSSESEHLIRNEASPALHSVGTVLTNLENASRGINDSVQAVRRVVGAAEGVSSPTALAGAALRIAATPRGKATLAGLAAAAIGVSSLLQGRAAKPHDTSS